LFTALWSAKGGVGVTTTAVALAGRLAESSRADVRESLLVDLGGDLPAATGLAEPTVGLTDWLSSSAGPDSLTRLEVAVGGSVSLIGLGAADDWPSDRPALLAAVLAADHRHVIGDLGVVGDGRTPLDGLRSALLRAAHTSLLVTRPCYLALRRAARSTVAPDGVVLIREPGRALDRNDVEGLLSVPVVAEIDLDPAVARAVDAGLLARHAPRHLHRALRGVDR
jgi:hypothetical protein